MDSALLQSPQLVFDFARCVICNAEGDVVGSMDDHAAAIIRDEQGVAVVTTRTKGGFVRHAKCKVFTDDNVELGYVSGRDLCAPDGKVLARIANSRQLTVGRYDVVDTDRGVIARVALSRTAGAPSIRGVPIAFGESHWQLDIADDVESDMRTLIIAIVPYWRGKELLALSTTGGDALGNDA